MVVRPAREALGMQRGIEAIRWLFMLTVLATLLVNPVFGWLVSRFRRLVFVNATYLFFAFGLVAFYLLLVLAPASAGANERPGVLRVVQRLQPVRDDAVLGADGGPLHAGAELSACSAPSRWAAHSGRSSARGSRASSRSPWARRRCCSWPPHSSCWRWPRPRGSRACVRRKAMRRLRTP